MSHDERIPALDGLRGIAVLAVFFYHLEPFVTTHAPVLRFAFIPAVNGWAGVDLFFVLSGYFITGGLLDTKGSPHYWLNFLIKRTTRIFPIYYLLLAAASVFFIVPWFFWIYLQNWFFLPDRAYPVALGHLWSLAIEEQFYVVWPFVVAYFSRGSLIKLCVAIIAGTLALRVGILIYHNSTAAHWFVFFSTITRFDGLAFGALGAAIVRSPEARGAMARVSLPIILASGLGLLLIFSHKGRIAAFHDLMTLTVGFSLTASLAFGIIMHVTLAHSGIIRRILNLSILRQAGHYSYAMYLIHWPAILASNSILIKIGFGHAFNATAMLCLPLLITSIGAWLSWNLIEAPALALRKPLIARLPAH